MLELRRYKNTELYKYLGTKDNGETNKKLKRYNVEYTTEGRGKECVYTITEINEPFRLFCVFDIGLDPRMDFTQFRDFMYLLLCDDDFNWRPAEMMEEIMRGRDNPASRQTIGKWLHRLEKTDLFSRAGEPVYYKVYKQYGVQKQEIVSKEEYSAAWKIYFDCKGKGYGSNAARSVMYNKFGGVPRKQIRFEQNGIYTEQLNRLTEIVVDEVLKEVGDLGKS